MHNDGQTTSNQISFTKNWSCKNQQDSWHHLVIVDSFSSGINSQCHKYQDRMHEKHGQLRVGAKQGSRNESDWKDICMRK